MRYELKALDDEGKETTVVYSGGKKTSDYVIKLPAFSSSGAQNGFSDESPIYGAPEALSFGYTTCQQALNAARGNR